MRSLAYGSKKNPNKRKNSRHEKKRGLIRIETIQETVLPEKSLLELSKKPKRKVCEPERILNAI